MTILTDEIKEFIVKALACYDTPTRVADAVNAHFGIEVSRQQVYRYDPKNPEPPAQRWRDLHAATRAALLRGEAEISVMHRLVRLRMLDRLAHRCERNSVALALICLKQAAMECGGMYENRRHVVVQVSALQHPEAQQQPAPESSESSTLQPSLPESRAVVTSIRLPQLPNFSGAVEAPPLNANRP